MRKEIKKSTNYFNATGVNALLFMVLLLAASCAQIVAPSGGRKDTKAPRVLKYTPDSAQLNFNSPQIELDFDEYVQLKDLNNQLIISPPMNKTPDIKVKNKTLTIDLKKQILKPNTTYSINFGNALQDLNEGNPIDNFKYIFSTGDYIDSLSVKGKVQDGFNHKVDKGILVMLYSDLNDSIVYKSQPDYFGKTNADGLFQINNIRPGKYRIFALKDENSDYKFNGGESIGFVEGTIDPSEKKSILIDLFQETPAKFFVKKYVHNEYGKVMLLFNRGSDSVQVKNLDPDVKPEQELPIYSANKDSLIYWIKNYDKDSLKLQVSNGSMIIDTLEFKLIKKEDVLKMKKSPLKLRLINNFNGNQGFDLNAPLSLIFSQPIAKINKNVVVNLKQDSIPMKHLGFEQDNFGGPREIIIGLWDSTVMAEDPNAPGKFVPAPIFSSVLGLKENTKYHLLIMPGTFTDIFGLTNDSIKIDFKTQEQKFYGSIKLKIDVPEFKAGSASAQPPQYIVQLMDEKENLLRQQIINGPETINYEFVRPQKYVVKIIYDENGNDKWDTGDYLKHIQPENIIYDSEEINVRSNWDLDLEWKIK